VRGTRTIYAVKCVEGWYKNHSTGLVRRVSFEHAQIFVSKSMASAAANRCSGIVHVFTLEDPASEC
jgi:hypothetical protein